jgi:serine/threonine protein phosphatase 1
MNWLRSLPYYFETEKQVFVHAAILPDLPMEEQPSAILTWECWDKSWLPTWDGTHRDIEYPKHVVHGHEQWENGPVLLESRSDLDTFAWYTGRLAIGVFDDSQGRPIDILWAEGEPHGDS